MLAVTLVVRDDSDLVATNIDYHLSRGADVFLVTVHRPSAATSAVLAHFVAVGKVVLWEEQGEALAQGEWVTRMARHAHCELGADWVIHVDADEFWWPKRGDLPHALASLPRSAGGALVARRNARPVGGDGAPFHERMVVFSRRAVNGLGEPLPAKVCHRGDGGVVVRDGNHRALSPTLGPIAATDAIEVLHFPMRTFSQFDAKIEIGARALRMNHRLSPRAGHVWQHLDELRRRGGLASYYDEHLVDARQVRAGLNREHLVVDDRLAQYLAGHPA